LFNKLKFKLTLISLYLSISTLCSFRSIW